MTRPTQDSASPSATSPAAFRLHEDLKAWLMREHPYAPAEAVVTALSYEIGRIVAQQTQDISPEQTQTVVTEMAVNGVRDVMLLHVAAFRRGMTL
jgi:predicted HD phosphohydrolase